MIKVIASAAGAPHALHGCTLRGFFDARVRFAPHVQITSPPWSPTSSLGASNAAPWNASSAGTQFLLLPRTSWHKQPVLEL
eukprot:CAMPEP_0178376190 /NCGR_PEP_ID=MMETSP0689_2-20121128/3274_1 /TAXON_ID=160604 /ORGANISM="Amphidinium massartii, Strain CS-259" /LENGTH=80 /DNA_ID=CAMNT_0019996203 /DNA_START=78 /DNA_END=320 /DNA_ORIENTATION=+